MICGIITSEGGLDLCVKAHMSVYIVLELCVDVEEKLGSLVLGMAIEMHPIAYCEPRGGFACLDPPISPLAVHAYRAFALFSKVHRGGYCD